MENLSLEFYLNTIPKIDLLHHIASLESKVAQQPDETDAQLDLAIAYHHLAQNGDKTAFEDCKALFAQLVQHRPDDPMVLAYQGNFLTWHGKLERAIHNKLKYTKQGIAQLDRAISLAPDNLIVRWVRAMNSYHLPSFFGRLALCLTDFEFIINHQDFRRWPRAAQAMIFYRAGLACQRDDNVEQAIQYFQLACDMAPESDWAKKAEQEWKAQKGKVPK